MKILLIGGGTGGHILPLRQLVDELKNTHVEILLSDSALDRRLAQENFSDIPVHFLQTGKIRRYFSVQNVLDFFRIVTSIGKAKKLLQKIQPDILFFKGGFVGFPVLLAAKFLTNFKGKIFSHESDISPGIMTRFASRFADTTFHSFGKDPYPLFYSSLQNSKFKIQNSSCTPPHRRSGEKTHILIFGGSQGSKFVNTLSLQCSDKLLEKYSITLISGVGKTIPLQHKHFQQFELLPFSKMAQEMQKAHLIVSRGGAGSLFEIVAAQIPSVIIPLPSVARNHQFLNAQYFAQKGLCTLLEEKDATPSTFLKAIEETLKNRNMIDALKKYKLENSAERIAELMLNFKGKR
ncbi:glycosyltransferase [Candidatus Gracilibacteria bacterium]|nr:glycosyltransferase [Candidatus Gracilibacteria bacterium]